MDPGYGGKVQLSTPIFFSRALERGLTTISGDSWATEIKELDTLHVLGSVLLQVSSQESLPLGYRARGGLVLIVLEHGHTALTVAGYTSESVTNVFARVRAKLPKRCPIQTRYRSRFSGRSSKRAGHWLCRPGMTSRRTILHPSPTDLTSLIDRGVQAVWPPSAVARPAGNR